MTYSAKLILASKSAARKTMLGNTGLTFDAMPSVVDEGAILCTMQEEGAGVGEIAKALAQAKALGVAKIHPDALVIGSDQALDFKGEFIKKAETLEAARAKLQRLSGQTHTLISAVTIAQGEIVLWQHSAEARLTMREFDDEFLDRYCARAGDALVHCVGAYEFEGLGSWLFSKVEGDFFTILGLPLLPVLNYLGDTHGVRP